MNIAQRLLTPVVVAVLACGSPVSPSVPAGSSMSDSRAPVEVTLFEQFPDVNPCTGQIVTYTFTGTARIQKFQEHSVLVAQGTVETSDGFSGTFNRQFVFAAGVTQLRFHDMEVSSATGQRIIFGVGLVHETLVSGQTVVSFDQFSGVRCVGK